MAAMIDPMTKAKLEAQRASILRWLECTAPNAECDQKHLDADSTEQAYWHLGYQSALSDVLNLLDPTAHPMCGKGDKPN